MVLVPVPAPDGQLERPEPPDVHAGIAFFDVVQVRKAVHQALHVQGIDQADRTHPEETHPAETENQADANGEDDDRRFGPSPNFVDATGELRSPALLIGTLGLVEPTKMRPPENPLLRPGNVFRRCFYRGGEEMISHPTSRG